MIEAGVALVIVGAALLVAEAHVPGGVLGVFGGVALATGLALAVAGAGAGIALVIASVLAAGAVTGLWLAVATRKALATRRLRISSGQRGAQRALRGRAHLGCGGRPGARRRRALASAEQLAGRGAGARGGGHRRRRASQRIDPGGTQG